jgi:adenine phosphoribosyltransferase
MALQKLKCMLIAIKKGWNVVIHDDLLATGGTAEAAAQLIHQGATVSAFTFIVGLDFLNGADKLSKHSNNIQCLVHY